MIAVLRQAAGILLLVAIITIGVGFVSAVFQPILPLGTSGASITPYFDFPILAAWNDTHLVIISEARYNRLVAPALTNPPGSGQTASLEDVDRVIVFNMRAYVSSPQAVGAMSFSIYAVTQQYLAKLKSMALRVSEPVKTMLVAGYEDAKRILDDLRKNSIVALESTCKPGATQCNGTTVVVRWSNVLSKTGGKPQSLREVFVAVLPLDLKMVLSAYTASQGPVSITVTLREIIEKPYILPDPWRSAPLASLIGEALSSSLMLSIDVNYSTAYVLVLSPRLVARMAFLGIVATGFWIAVCKYTGEPCKPRIQFLPESLAARLKRKKGSEKD